MESSPKVGRNSSCPCGSGKKYKRCCGDFYQTGVMFFHDEKAGVAPSLPQIALHKAIAYAGNTGRIREEFCRQYIARKQTVFKHMENDLLQKTSSAGEKITCREGCSFCCSQYISGTLHEAETIVYHLYRHEAEMNRFLKAYPDWFTTIHNTGEVFTTLETCFAKLVEEGETEAGQQAYQQAKTRFLAENIPCPFLNEGSCSIYPVRPWCCAGIVATTPGEYCSPFNTGQPRVYGSSLRPKEVPFFRHTRDMVIVNIPRSVFGILNGGYGWLSGIPGLERLEKEVAADPEVRGVQLSP